MRIKNALLVSPTYPSSYWAIRDVPRIHGGRSNMPPLGLLTIASLFPDSCRLKVVDMNVSPLTDEDLEWADAVFTSSMIVQKTALQEVVKRCNRMGVPIIAGGPYPTSFYESLLSAYPEGQGVTHFVLGEAEDIFSELLSDLEAGNARRLYQADGRPDVTRTPVPRFDLIDLDRYISMCIQFSRGCPFDCEFCDITKLFGRVPRTKTDEQVLSELELLYELGWRRNVFFVDDNFIGNKREAARIMPALIQWQKERGYPFAFYTEASINLEKMETLMDAMVEAGFYMVFIGIESPTPETLRKTSKSHNTRPGVPDYLLRAVRKIQSHGLQVSAGFILGLDGDGPEIFDTMTTFIQELGIPMAMTSLLTVLKGTNLEARFIQEGRFLEDSDGNNTRAVLNYVPELPPEQLIEGYRKVIGTLYDPSLERYFERCLTMLDHVHVRAHNRAVSLRRLGKAEWEALLYSLRHQLLGPHGKIYAKFLARVLIRYPRMFPEAVRLAILGRHFRDYTREVLQQN